MFSSTSKPSVAIYGANPIESACPAIRLMRPLHHAGWPVRVGTEFGFNRSSIDIQAAREADLVVIQRNLPNPYNYTALRYIAKLGVPMVYDLDDAFLDIPSGHPGRVKLRPMLPYIRWMLKQADLITVSTECLAQTMRPFSKQPIAVVPNMVDWEWFSNTPRQRGPTCNLLVAGTPTHRADWALIEQPLLELLAERPGKVKLIFFGDLPERFKEHTAVEAVPFEASYERYAGLLRGLNAHIALVPLEDTKFNRAKSNIKWLEYSAAGIVGIYSDAAAYRATVVHGQSGLLIQNTAAEWKRAIGMLIDDAALCQTLATNAQAAVRSHHTIEAGLSSFEQVMRKPLGSRHAYDAWADLVLEPARFKYQVGVLFHRHLGWRFQRPG